MRHFLISALFLSLVAGCSSVNIGPHRIDVQQGNALDQENVARLKPGLNRSQVRFLLGTPLVVDPFRTDRWDYVYVYYKAGRLAEQKRITLFFDGDTLARIEGDLPEPLAQPPAPAAAPIPEPQSAPATPVAPPPAATARAAEPVEPPKPVVQAVPVASQPAPVAAHVVAQAAAARAEPVPQPAAPETSSVVPPLPSPKNVPAYANPRQPAELSLQAETDVAKIRPDAIPSFPEAGSAPAGSDALALKSVNEWVAAWARRDKTAYFAAYDDRFVPQDGISRAEWEKRKRQMLDTAKNIEVKIDSPLVNRTEEGTVTVTFNQFYRTDNYNDAVVKQLHMVERDGRWLIVEERVLSILRGAQP
ncbi:outer membrane protein assembly factor BamE domain-containing protein [Thiobacillus sp.]